MCSARVFAHGDLPAPLRDWIIFIAISTTCSARGATARPLEQACACRAAGKCLSHHITFVRTFPGFVWGAATTFLDNPCVCLGSARRWPAWGGHMLGQSCPEMAHMELACARQLCGRLGQTSARPLLTGLRPEETAPNYSPASTSSSSERARLERDIAGSPKTIRAIARHACWTGTSNHSCPGAGTLKAANALWTRFSRCPAPQ